MSRVLVLRKHGVKRSVALGVVAAVAVMAVSLVVGPAAYGEEPAPVPPAATESPAPDAGSTPDPLPADAPVVELTGTLLVSVSEGTPDAGLGSLAADPGGATEYAVQTPEGTIVPIESELPADAVSGDAFEGVVALPEDVIDALPQSDAEQIVGASGPLASDSEAAIAAQAAASDLGTVLPASDITVSPALTFPQNTVSHTLYIAVVNPSGSSATFYDNAAVADLSTYVSNYWRTQSEGDIPSFTTSPTVKRYTSTSGCADSPFTRWQEAGDQFFPGGVPAGQGVHIVVLLPNSCLGGAGVGVGTIGNGPNYGGFTQITVGGGVDRSALAHEIGHNLGLNHANLDWCGPNNDIAGCTNNEYWDIYDVMGFSVTGVTAVTTLNGASKVALGFIDGASVSKVALTAGQLNGSSTVALQALDTLAGVQVIEVVDPVTAKSYFIEYRAGANSDASAVYTNSASIYDIGGGSWVAFGAGLRILTQSSGSGIGSTALTRWVPAGYASTVLTPSQSYSIPGTGVTITFVSGTPASGASVRVALTRAQPVYRFWSPVNQTHFYTISRTERNTVISTLSDVWSYEGPAYLAYRTQQPGTIPVFRFYSSVFKGHFYTTSTTERDHTIAELSDVWTYEGPVYYVYPGGATGSVKGVYRFWSAQNSHHFYTASASERDATIANYDDYVWNYEGVAFKVPTG